jgi:hypothetical protein
MLLRRPEPCGVRPLGGTRDRTFGWEGGCSCAGWGSLVRQLPPGCFIPTDCGETRTLASVWRVTSHAAGSDCLNCLGREPVPLVTEGLRGLPRSRPRGTARRFEAGKLVVASSSIRAEAAVRCTAGCLGRR